MSKLSPVCFLFALVLFTASVTTANDAAAQAEQRKAAVNRPRTVIYYNGGEEPLFWSKDAPFSVDTFLAQRIAPLKNSKVDTIFYAPVSAFGFMTVKIPSSDLINHQPEGSKWLAGVKNVTPDFIAAGTDPLKEVVKWSKANNKEVFAVLCPNNTHHGTEWDFSKPPPPYTWDSYLFPPFKVKNTGMLMGGADKFKGKVTHGDNPPHGVWSGVDYAQGAVREKFFENSRDICAGYDIDGLCIDFMRSPMLFKSVATGGKASNAERKHITDLLRRIRVAADEAGQKRGRPILLAVRVPDSVPYCKEIGIDLEAWMLEKLVDIVVGGGGFQLNPWSYMTALCKKGGVKFYASLDESGIWIGNDSGGHYDDDRMPRQCPETYRARVMDARVAGVDGVLFANRFDEDWRRGEIKNYHKWMCGDPNEIKTLSKRYFITYRTIRRGAGRFLKGGAGHATLPELSAHNFASLKSGTETYSLYVWDNLAELKKSGVTPALLLTTEAVIPNGTELEITLNGRKLEMLRKVGGVQKFSVPPEAVKYGDNKVILKAKGRNKSNLQVEVRNLALDVTFEGK